MEGHWKPFFEILVYVHLIELQIKQLSGNLPCCKAALLDSDLMTGEGVKVINTELIFMFIEPV